MSILILLLAIAVFVGGNQPAMDLPGENDGGNGSENVSDYQVELFNKTCDQLGDADVLASYLNGSMGQYLPDQSEIPTSGNANQVPGVYAITDVMVCDNDNLVPQDYTGLQHVKVTSPYIPGVIGERVPADDVNAGIGGTTTRIWVKYSLVDPNNDTMVLTGIDAVHWADWHGLSPDPEHWGLPNASSVSPEGWMRANGTSNGIPGALTTGTVDSNWRMGLCVQYKPINEVYESGQFINNVFLCYTTTPYAVYPKLAFANGEMWMMHSCGIDIHTQAHDKYYVFVCYSKGRYSISGGPPKPTVTPAMQYELLQEYAPRVYISNFRHGEGQAEGFLPSSVEWAFPYFCRLPFDGVYCLQTKEALNEVDQVLDFFHGNGNFSADPVYAYWVQKDYGFVDLVYFMYYPFTCGKQATTVTKVCPTTNEYDYSVSGWEHMTIRLMWTLTGDQWELKPIQVYLAAHDFGNVYDWDGGPLNKVGGTHPSVYAAWGSHGLWATYGSHFYKSVKDQYGETINIADDCGQGPAWDTWKNVSAMDYTNKTGLGGNSWPVWMSTNINDPGTGDPSNPASGSIYRWGNPKSSFNGDLSPIYDDGPYGPAARMDIWDPDSFC